MNRIGSLLLFIACLLLPASLFAASHQHGKGNDHVGFGNTITIDEGQSAGDVVCFFCTVKVHGDVSGDIVTFFGDVQVDGGRTVTGDSVVFGGHLSLADQAQIHGDLVLFGGEMYQAPSANVHGDRVVFSGTGWLLVLLSPLLIPIGLIWLAIHLIRRHRYQFPAYPPHRY